MSMPNLLSSFISYHLTEQELIQGSILTITQKQCIQNQISTFAEERINLPFLDANKQRDAELQGNIRALQNLLIISENAEKAYAGTPDSFVTNY